MLVHLFPKYFEIIFLSPVYGSVWEDWPPKRSNPRFGLIFFSFKASFSQFQGLIRYFLLTSIHISNFEIFLHLAKNRPKLFFSTILDYNLTKSPTYFIFVEYAVGGVSNFMLVFEKIVPGVSKLYALDFFYFWKITWKDLIQHWS